ncbi:MAG: CinA family protein [Clostridiales bacterium]|nr:CinA family protein [Clostridiales bacterium]
MKVGFLSINKMPISIREAKIALFDAGHTIGPVITVTDETQTAWAHDRLREECDAIVIDGDTDRFYGELGEHFSMRPDNFEIDGKLYAVTSALDSKYLTENIIPKLNAKNKKQRYRVVVFKTFGKTEEELKTILKAYLKKSGKVQIGLFPDYLECEVRVRAASTISQTDLNGVLGEINKLLYKFTYAFKPVTIAERVAEMLTAHNLKIKIAESFTGGAIARAFTSIPGASEYLVEGLVTYSVTSKIKRLGVPAESIAEHGVVSSDTAYRMAAGLIQSGDCDIAIATTGNAGPTAQYGQVGLCYVAIGNKSEVHTVKYTFGEDRDDNIKRGVINTLFLLYNYLALYEAMESGAAQDEQ